MNNFLILLITTISILKLEAQEYTLLQKIEIESQSIEVDKFDFIYIVETYKISKYSSEGQFLNAFEAMSYGEISNLDISNPLKPLVYYKDFNVFSVLDNKLSEINTIDLFEKNVNQIELICSSNNMEYWTFDNIENRLKKLDKQFNTINESELFFNLFDNFSFPKELKIRNNNLYSLDNYGISIFDLYGAFIKKISVQNLESFQIFDKDLVFLEEDSLRSFNEKTLQSLKMKLPQMNEVKRQAKLLRNKLVIRTQSFINIYSIE